MHVTYQCIQVDIGPLDIFGHLVGLHHRPPQNIQVFLCERDERTFSLKPAHQTLNHKGAQYTTG